MHPTEVLARQPVLSLLKWFSASTDGLPGFPYLACHRNGSNEHQSSFCEADTPVVPLLQQAFEEVPAHDSMSVEKDCLFVW